MEDFGRLSIVLHKVHMDVSTTGPGGDITAGWLSEHPEVEGIEWITLGITDIHAKLFREASLANTTVDVGFVMNEYFTPEIASLFEPLDEYIKNDPIEEWDDVFPGLKDMTKINGVTYAIPFRTTVTGLHYNAADFKQRGLPEPRQHMYIEELQESMQKLRFTRSDGTDVFPFLIPGNDAGNVTDIARAWDGDFISMDFKSGINGTGMRNAVSFLQQLYADGLYPKAYTTLTNNDLNTWFQQGRIVMASQATGKNKFYNSPDGKVAGQIKTISFPISEQLSSQYKVAPVKSSLWSLVIPKNARNKELSWSFIKNMLSSENTLSAAINGNGPAKMSIYDNAEYRSKNKAYWQAELESLSVARPTNPAFSDAQKSKDIFLNYVQQAVLGRMSVEDALNQAHSEVERLLPE